MTSRRHSVYVEGKFQRANDVCLRLWGPGGTLWVLGQGCATQKSKIVGVPRLDCEVSGFDLDQLGPTLFRRMCCFCGPRFGRFLASVLARGIQISEKKMQARQWTRLGSGIPMHMSLHSFPFLISKPNYSFFEGAHFDFQAESIQFECEITVYWDWEASSFWKCELNFNTFVLFEGKANEIYSAKKWRRKTSLHES